MEPSERRVAVVGGGRATALRDALASLPYRAAERSAADAIVAIGDDALRDVLVDVPDVPVIPVGSRWIAVDDVDAERRVRRLLDGALRDDERGSDSPDDAVRRTTHPILTVDSGSGEPRRAVFDVALVTAEPARISEFAVDFVGGDEAAFRADGVVVATPLGSDGYANAAGGPVVEPGGGLSVASIAPFSTRTDAWVAAEGLSLSVERETESVALVVDGRECETVTPHRPVSIEAADSVTLVTRSGARRARRSETL
ncbi:ATP-NAD kinase [Halorubrum sp. HHNYT27]|uniref:ATP-NAD kinase n=1 Tax=Halorubrum sp. HHNYT27 TaxID=3402275 RepID=UPI003EB7E9CD